MPKHLVHDRTRTLQGIYYLCTDLYDLSADELDDNSFSSWPDIQPWRVKQAKWQEATNVQRLQLLLVRAGAALAEDGGVWGLAPRPQEA